MIKPESRWMSEHEISTIELHIFPLRFPVSNEHENLCDFYAIKIRQHECDAKERSEYWPKTLIGYKKISRGNGNLLLASMEAPLMADGHTYMLWHKEKNLTDGYVGWKNLTSKTFLHAIWTSCKITIGIFPVLRAFGFIGGNPIY